MPNKLFRVHPRNYGKDSRRCRLCKNRRGKIAIKKVWLDNMKWCSAEDASEKIELPSDSSNTDEKSIFNSLIFTFTFLHSFTLSPLFLNNHLVFLLFSLFIK